MELTINQVNTIVNIKEVTGVDVTKQESGNNLIAAFMSTMLDDILEDIVEGLVIGLDPEYIQNAKDEILKRSKTQ